MVDVSPCILRSLRDLEYGDPLFVNEYDIVKSISEQISPDNAHPIVDRFLVILESDKRYLKYCLFSEAIKVMLTTRFDEQQFVRIIKIAIDADANMSSRISKECWQSGIAYQVWFNYYCIPVDTMRLVQSIFMREALFPLICGNEHLASMTSVNALPAILAISNRGDRSKVLSNYLSHHKDGDMPAIMKQITEIAYPHLYAVREIFPHIWPENGLTNIVSQYLNCEPITIYGVYGQLMKL